MFYSGFLCGRLAGAQLAVNLQKGLVAVFGGVLALQSGDNGILVAENVQHIGIGAHVVRQGALVVFGNLLQGHVVPHPQQGADEGGHRDLAVFIDADVENIAGIGFVLQPRAAVGDYSGFKQLFAGFVEGVIIIYAGRTDQLGNNDALGAVDNKSAAFRHQREIPHVDFLLVDLAGFLIKQACPHMEGGVIGHVAHFAFRHRVFRGFIQTVIDKVQNQVARIVRDRGNIAEHFLKPLIQKPFVRIDLHLDQVRHFQDLIDVRETHTGVFSELHRLDIHHRLSSLHSSISRGRKTQVFIFPGPNCPEK